MPLTLLLGPANCGKVALLLDRFVEAVESGASPYLVVPTRPDVELAERDLVQRRAALLGGMIGTFDDLFERVLARCGRSADSLGGLERRLAVERSVREAQLETLAAPARFTGFGDGLARLFDEVAAAAEPDQLERRLTGFAQPGRRAEIAALHAGYRALLEGVGTDDRSGLRGQAAALLGGRLEAWDETPVFAYGFEDVTGVQLAALRALSGRCPVTVSLPYEAGRPAFAAVRWVVDALTEIPHEVVELPPGRHFDAPSLLHLERTLFDERDPAPAPEPDGGVVLLEACGVRGVADQVAFEALELIRGGTPADEIGVLTTDTGAWRLSLESAFDELGVPVDVDAPLLLGDTGFGQALMGLIRFAWFDGDRGDLFRFLRSPFSGIPRTTVDYAEGRLRGRGALSGAEVRQTMDELDYPRLLAAAERLSQQDDPLAQLVDLVRRMSAAAGGLTARRQTAAGERHAAALRAVLRAIEQMRSAVARGLAVCDRAVLAAQLERVTWRSGDPGSGRVAVLDLRRARTRRFQAVFLLGLEEGSFPGGARESAFLSADEAAELGIARIDSIQRDRHLFYTAVTRPWRRLFLCRQAADDDGRLLRAVALPRGRRASDGRSARAAPARRSATSPTSSSRPPRSGSGCGRWPVNSATGRTGRHRWPRSRAGRASWSAPGPLTAAARGCPNPAVLAALADQHRFSVTELEKFAECSSAWFVERFLQPGEIDYEFGAKETGSVAHTTLHRFHERMPGELGVERLTEAELPRAVPLMRRCLHEALANVRIPSGAAGKEAVRRLERDLEGFMRSEAVFVSPLVPRDYEVRFGTKSSPANLQQGLVLDGFSVSGTIDRIDRDPSMSARGMVWDYKTGKGAKSAAQIETERKLQLPLYILVMRDLLGIEPVAGLYRALGGERKVRGMAVKGEIEGVMRNDQLDPAEFWEQVERAVGYANAIVARVRAGDVLRDPIGRSCPEWCLRQAGGICRVAR